MFVFSIIAAIFFKNEKNNQRLNSRATRTHCYYTLAYEVKGVRVQHRVYRTMQS